VNWQTRKKKLKQVRISQRITNIYREGAEVDLSLVVNRPGREAEHSPPSSAAVKNVWDYRNYSHFPIYISSRRDA
jgi:hypothetical protein